MKETIIAMAFRPWDQNSIKSLTGFSRINYNNYLYKYNFINQNLKLMPFINVMIHFIWSTKNRYPLISKELKPLLLSHIKQNSIKKEIFIDCLNCVEDHIHLLISVGTGQTIDKLEMLIKGESSFWVNQKKLLPQKFEWQDEYIAVSVSESATPKVRAYIANQEEHHRKQTFIEEYNAFLNAYNFSGNNFG